MSTSHATPLSYDAHSTCPRVQHGSRVAPKPILLPKPNPNIHPVANGKPVGMTPPGRPLQPNGRPVVMEEPKPRPNKPNVGEQLGEIIGEGLGNMVTADDDDSDDDFDVKSLSNGHAKVSHHVKVMDTLMDDEDSEDDSNDSKMITMTGLR